MMILLKNTSYIARCLAKTIGTHMENLTVEVGCRWMLNSTIMCVVSLRYEAHLEWPREWERWPPGSILAKLGLHFFELCEFNPPWANLFPWLCPKVGPILKHPQTNGYVLLYEQP